MENQIGFGTARLRHIEKWCPLKVISHWSLREAGPTISAVP
jgi:hypothetical protein